MQHTKLIPALAVAAALGASGAAFAAGQGDFLVRGGVAYVSPTSESESILGGNEVEAESATALGLTAAYFVTDNVAVELLASSPFSHDIEGSAGGIDGVDVATVRQLPPTLSVQYHLQLGMPLRPYAGIGVNFTRFFDDDLEQEFRNLGLGFNDIDLKNSWGVAFQLGADYEVTPEWLVNVGLRYIDIDTDARLNNPTGDDVDFEVEIDPVVFELGVGYVF